MHQRRRETRTARAKRVVIGSALAAMVATGVAVVSWDPTEALCAAYTESDPMWYLLGCWRFPAR